MIKMNDSNSSDKVAQLCFKHYSQLGQRGKPLSTEWTLLASVVQSVDNDLSVVSMATGTKCIGCNAMSPKGDIINDSHAEVLARRCFLRYLYEQVENVSHKGCSDIFSGYNSNGKCVLRPNIHFILFTSHVPCGDASIIPKISGCEKRKCTFGESDEHEIKKIKTEIQNSKVNEDSCVNVMKNINTSADDLIENKELNLKDDIGDVVDIHRTGAKCIGDKKDFKLPGIGYHVLGAVRTKPGRGDQTLSVSCSDKMARWIAIGIQGACLSLLIEDPVFLKLIVVAAGGPYSHDALHRALVARSMSNHSPELSQSSLVFTHSRYKACPQAKPCPTSILWAKVSNKSLEIGVDGRRQGTTKKTIGKGQLTICKLELFKRFLLVTGEKYKGMTYRDVKDMAMDYQEEWRCLKKRLGVWTEKPKGLTRFVCEV